MERVEEQVEKRKSGSNKRQRTEEINLRLLPSERRALRALADQAGHPTVQAWIRDTIAPHLEGIARSGV